MTHFFQLWITQDLVLPNFIAQLVFTFTFSYFREEKIDWFVNYFHNFIFNFTPFFNQKISKIYMFEKYFYIFCTVFSPYTLYYIYWWLLKQDLKFLCKLRSKKLEVRIWNNKTRIIMNLWSAATTWSDDKI